MLTRATAEPSEQDDPFGEEVTFLLPASLAESGGAKVGHGNGAIISP
jgi:hypothetical protein